MNTQLKLLQFNCQFDKTIDCYFVIKAGKEQYFSSTFKFAQGLNDCKEKFNINATQYIDFELWDYWNLTVYGIVRVDSQKILRERKDMHILQIRGEKFQGELMAQLIFEEEVLSLQSSLKEKASFGMQPSFLSQQGASFYDNYLNDKVYMSASRSTQYRPTQSPVLQIKK